MTQSAPPLRKFAGFVRPEKNYFPMPNEWIDICAEIDNLAELKIIQYVIRHTWGFQEYGIPKTISVDEFMYGRKRTNGTRMDNGTGLKSDRSVKDGIKAAIEHGYLLYEIDTSDPARMKKSYTLKMIDTGVDTTPQVDTTPLHDKKTGVQSTPLAGSIYPPGGYNLPLDQVDTTPRSEKDTIERHYKKDTEERQEREVATATARSQTSSQNDLEETVKREAVKPRTPVQEVTQANTNAVQHPPAPRKPPTNSTIPKRPRPQQQELTDELPPSPPSKPVEPLAEMAWGTRKCLQWFDYWRGGTLIAKYKLQQAAGCAKGLAEQFDEATVIQIRNDMAADQYYIERGGPDVCDVANNIHKYINKKKPKKEPSNEHKVSSFGTPGFNFADEFYPSEAEKKAYYAAHPIGGKV